MAYTSSRTVALALICLVTFAHMAWKTNLVTITNDIYPKHVVGSVSGIVAFGNGVGGTLFTYLTGHIVQAVLLRRACSYDGYACTRSRI